MLRGLCFSNPVLAVVCVLVSVVVGDLSTFSLPARWPFLGLDWRNAYSVPLAVFELGGFSF